MKITCPDCGAEHERKSAPSDEIDELCSNCYQKELLGTQTRLAIEIFILIIGIVVACLMIRNDPSFRGILDAIVVFVVICVIGIPVILVPFALLLRWLSRKAIHWKPNKPLKIIAQVLAILLLVLLQFTD